MTTSFPNSPEPLNSVLLQAGWSIFSGRLTLIVYQRLQDLPSLLRKGDALEHVKLRPFPAEEFDPSDVLMWIKAQKLFQLIKPDIIWSERGEATGES